MASDIIAECEQVPVIDLSHDVEGTYINVRKACEEWGCFLLVNHGIKEEIIHQMDSAAGDMFKLPKETKQRNMFPGGIFGYIPPSPGFPFHESLGLPGAPDPDAIQLFSDQLWPQGNPIMRKIIQAYASGVDELTKNIIKVILRSFGVGENYTPEIWGFLRLNYYDVPASEIGGISPHSDKHFITVMYQDNKGGLEVLNKAGKWADVKPVDNSFVVFMGDCIKAWSNGRIHNAVHRVRFGGGGSENNNIRVSLPFFYFLPEKTAINAPSAFVDDDHPRLYKPFLYAEYKEFYYARNRIYFLEKESFQSLRGVEFLDKFARIQSSE